MKLTLIQPAMGRESARYVRSWQMEPLSMATLASLTPSDVELTFFDDWVEPIDYDAPTDAVAITVETYTARRAYQIASAYRARGVPIIMGYHATLVPNEVELFADAVIVGDAEVIWSGVLDDAKKGQLQQRYRATERVSLEGIMPDRRIFAGKRYLPLTLVEAGRGCRFACDFCSIAAFSEHTYRSRPAAEVAREIVEAGRKRVFLVDDNFAADPFRAKEMLRALAPLDITWIGQASLQVTEDDEFLALLEKSGCIGLLVGFESLDEATLESMNKRFNRGAGRYKEAIAKLRDRGLKLYATFVFGYDNDPVDAFERTLAFALEEKFMVAAFNHLQPFPGTPRYDRLEREGRLLYHKWWLEEGYRFGRIAFSPKSMSPDELFNKLMQTRREFFSLSNILKRATDTHANANSLGSFWLHLTVNWMLRREIDQKWRLPLGDSSEAQPEVPNARPVATAV